jgi:hypothetical protein
MLSVLLLSNFNQNQNVSTNFSQRSKYEISKNQLSWRCHDVCRNGRIYVMVVVVVADVIVVVSICMH